jgi:hypothetical protein
MRACLRPNDDGTGDARLVVQDIPTWGQLNANSHALATGSVGLIHRAWTGGLPHRLRLSRPMVGR